MCCYRGVIGADSQRYPVPAISKRLGVLQNFGVGVGEALRRDGKGTASASSDVAGRRVERESPVVFCGWPIVSDALSFCVCRECNCWVQAALSPVFGGLHCS